MDHNGIEIGVAIEVKNDENINISDVIEIIETDPDFVNDQPMFSGGGEIRQSSQNQRSVAMPSLMQPSQTQSHQPYIKIIEQPASKALRFRYECEGRSAGSIPGASSTPENKTFPTIQVVGYRGRAVVVVSCVTKDEPYRAHPHNLVGREGCKKGVCTLEIPQETMTVSFSNLGIQCVKKKDIEEALRVREEIRVDPFRKGFSHRNQPTQIDLNAVRLCFQVFMEGSEPGRYTVPLQPVVSDVIYDKKAMSDLVICKLSDCSATVAGGKEIILLCEKVAKEDIQVKFFEEKNNTTVWEGFGDFQPSHVHKQVAISFRTPRYHTLDVTDSIKVYIQLWRPSDKATSEPLPFEFLPLDSGRPPFWSLRNRKLQKKGNYATFSQILSCDNKMLTLSKKNLKNNNNNVDNVISKSADTNFDSISLDSENDPEPTLKEVLENTKQVLETTKKVLESNFDDSIIVEDLNEPPQKIFNQSDSSNSYGFTSKSGSVTLVYPEKAPQNNFNQPENINSFENQSEGSISLGYVTKAPQNQSQGSISLGYPSKVPQNNFNQSESPNPLGFPPKVPLGQSQSSIVENNNILVVVPNSESYETQINSENKSLNDLLNQVVELDEIYSDTQARLLLLTDEKSPETILMDVESQIVENDHETYSSLQMAFKNPIDIKTSNVNVVNVKGPLIDITKFKRDFIASNDSDDKDKAPPFPPKRIKKMSLTSSQNFDMSDKRTNSFDNLCPNKKLPPTPSSTLPNPKKSHGFFSKLFSKKKNKNKSDEVMAVDDGIVENDSSRLGKVNDKVGNDINENENDEFINLDLTDAEHYALYTAMAPHATQSEFDELSCYYSPVEGGKILNNSNKNEVRNDPVVLKRKRQKMGNEHMLRHLQEQEKARNLPPINNMLNIPADTPIKLEPRDATSPFGGSQVGVSPFNPGATSPLPYIFPNDTVVGGTPSPINYNFTNNASVPNQFQAIPIQQQNWLGPISNMETNSVTNTNNLNTGTFNIANNQTMNIPNNNNNEVGSIINLDSQELLQINTEELVGFDEQDNMSERFSQNLSLSENRRENMTDSLTRIATDTLNRFLE